jgi:6-phosphogluconolactonase/glucosamine-6-phosphate isomerase/deaminase
MNIHHETSDIAAARGGGQYLSKLLSESQPALVLVSGGSALRMLDHVSADASRVTLGVLDERFSVAPKYRNAERLTRTPFGRQVQQFGRVLDLDQGVFRSVDGFAKHVERQVLGWVEGHPEGVVICTQGIGEDGHTAGMLPMPQDADRFAELFAGDRRFAGYDTAGKGRFQYRMTATVSFLREVVDVSIVFMVGDSKRRVFRSVQAGKAPLHEMPANIVHQMKKVHLFTDL